MTDRVVEIEEMHLNMGEFHFGEGLLRLRTLLGSCIAITLWHPHRKIGGMCHYMLPSRPRPAGAEPDGRFADEAFELFDRAMARSRTRPSDYHAKVFGGGNMFPNADDKSTDVGAGNIRMARTLLLRRDIETVAEHVGDYGHRKIAFDIWSGDVWVSHQDIAPEARTVNE